MHFLEVSATSHILPSSSMAAGGVREGRSAEEEAVDSGGVPAYM